MTCPVCGDSGYRRVEVPVFADGGYSDVEQIEERCACNPEPTDEDAPDWDDVPGTAYDDFHHFNDHKYEGI